jgi:(hydroxyamino)benzene mutase
LLEFSVEEPLVNESAQRNQLYFFGMILFLLGLLAGFATPAFRNPRLGLSAHLEGVMNGMFLIVVGLIWQKVALSASHKKFAFGLLLWGAYANWTACLLGGIFGASRMTPIAGGSFTAEPWQELLVSGLFASVGLAMLVAILLLAWGLRGVSE